MFSLQRLLGKEDKFFNLLEASAEEARTSVRALVRFNQGLDRQAMVDDLESARLRFFGGTTAIWGGRCAHLDPVDFDRRDWVPHSGWPFGADELDRWYAEARAMLGLPPQRARRGAPSGLLAQLPGEEVAVHAVAIGGELADREFFAGLINVVDR